MSGTKRGRKTNGETTKTGANDGGTKQKETKRLKGSHNEANDGGTKQKDKKRSRSVYNGGAEVNDGETKQGKNLSDTPANRREIRLQAALKRSQEKADRIKKQTEERLKAVLRRRELEREYKALIESFERLKIQLYPESQLRF